MPSEIQNQEPVMISALEHYSYCPRQYALIHREQTFDENIYTLRGKADHERVDEGVATLEDGVRVERSLPLWSQKLGLVGKADVVEFHNETPYPVEYKHGRRKPDRHADIQVCAQAMCLEEMLGCNIPKGAIYHISSRQRREVKLTPALRQRVFKAIEAIREIESQDHMPPPVADRRCPPCSLEEACMPWTGAKPFRIRRLHKKLYSPEE